MRLAEASNNDEELACPLLEDEEAEGNHNEEARAPSARELASARLKAKMAVGHAERTRNAISDYDEARAPCLQQ